MDQEGLKLRLINVIDSGLNAKAIAKKINITYDILAKFKQGRLYLAPKDYAKLEAYLDKGKRQIILRIPKTSVLLYNSKC